MKTIILDTETISFPKDYENEDIMFQLSLIEETNNKLYLFNDYMQPNRYIEMSPRAMAVTHKTPDDIEKYPKKEDTEAWNYLKEILENPQEETFVVAHNIDFDLNVIKLSGINIHKDIKFICTLKVSAFLNDYLGLPFEQITLQYMKYFNRLDKQKEDINKLLNISNDLEAHNAIYDVVDTYLLLKHFTKQINATYENLHLLTIKPYILKYVPFGKNKYETFQSLNEYQLKYYAGLDGNVSYTARTILNERYNNKEI